MVPLVVGLTQDTSFDPTEMDLQHVNRKPQLVKPSDNPWWDTAWKNWPVQEL
jgi:hypothetical protein